MGIGTFWAGRRVFVTGHTGFKGAWLCLWLQRLGAVVSSAALAPSSSPSLYGEIGPWAGQTHTLVDIRDGEALSRVVAEARPEIVLHLAAQALVRRSYAAPAETYATNVMGLVNLLEAVRGTDGVRTVLVVTSDKVYENNGAGQPFAEQDTLGGHDPYSNSKACAELVCRSYRDSFLREAGIHLATARAGNVIGGGDWSQDRLIPDFVRALEAGKPVRLRYPQAVRPWQHVLESLHGYLLLAQALDERRENLPQALNFGPAPAAFASVAQVAEALAAAYGRSEAWAPAPGPHPPEAATLTLCSDLATATLGWRPRLALEETLGWTAAWYQAHHRGADMRDFTLRQIEAYEGLLG